jgi:hypothetical protein
MDMHSRNEYLKVLKERYLKAKTKKEKSQILDEYCRNTGQSRKYVIRKIHPRVNLEPRIREKRKQTYGSEVKATLAKVWGIFDYPCGQRLKPILELELERSRGGPKPGSLLKQKIPIRLTQWDTSQVGYVEMDLVVHCGSSTLGEYINTVSTTEVSSGWWEGEAIMGKSQESTFWALKEIRKRTPFEWKGLDSDNGSEFINGILYKYCQRERLEFTRSRPSRKNDNAYIEQKNWTHVRKVLGYLRYDTVGELAIINDLYRGELRLYKNFFQPMMKLVSKERIGGRVKRKYDIPQSPYQRLMESDQVSEESKRGLEAIYLSMNPAQLKRSIDAKLDNLYHTYEEKGRVQQVDPCKRLVPRTVTSFMMQQPQVGLPT